MLNWLNGKKTYAVAVITFVLGGLQAAGVAIPPWIYPLLAAAGLGSLRDGVKKLRPPQ